MKTGSSPDRAAAVAAARLPQGRLPPLGLEPQLPSRCQSSRKCMFRTSQVSHPSRKSVGMIRGSNALSSRDHPAALVLQRWSHAPWAQPLLLAGSPRTRPAIANSCRAIISEARRCVPLPQPPSARPRNLAAGATCRVCARKTSASYALVTEITCALVHVCAWLASCAASPVACA